MKEVALKRGGNSEKTTTFVVNLDNAETGERVTHKYSVVLLSGRAAMESQLSLAEFARQDNAKEIVGSLLFKSIIDRMTPLDGAPDFLELFDWIDNDMIKPLMTGLVDAATGSSVG